MSGAGHADHKNGWAPYVTIPSIMMFFVPQWHFVQGIVVSDVKG